MNHTRRVLVCLLGLVVILSILVFPVSAQGNDSGAAKSEEDYLLQSQRNLDRSLTILDTVATLIGVLVAILALVIALVGGLGFLEIKKWHLVRDNMEKDAQVLKNVKIKAEKDAETKRNEVGNIPQSISLQKPTDEIRKKLDDFSRHLETLELLGASLKPEDFLKRGNDFYYKKDYESALKAYEKAIELKSDYAEVWSNKGVVLSKLGRYEEAIEAYEKVIELKSNIANPWFHRACAHSQMGNKEKALSDLKKAIELDVFYKEKAKKDEDFKTLLDDKDFKKLVE